MGILSWLRRRPKPATSFLYIYLPERIEDAERQSKYVAPLTVELQLAGVGLITGGGALEEEATGRIIHTAIDVEAHDRDAARALLRAHLPDLGCPPDTRLEWFDQVEWQDLYTGAGWEEAQPMTSYAERPGYA